MVQKSKDNWINLEIKLLLCLSDMLQDIYLILEYTGLGDQVVYDQITRYLCVWELIWRYLT